GAGRDRRRISSSRADANTAASGAKTRHLSEDCPFTGHRVPMRPRPPAPPRCAISRFMPMLISPAYAQGTGLLDQSALVQFLPLVLIFVVFYFLLIRPQQKKQKDQRAMLGALRRGDRVVTGGGILGTVSKVVSP